MMPLSEALRKAASKAVHDNSLLANMAPQERLEAAQWYEDFAAETVGTKSDLARLYNLERARFLRGQAARIAHSAPAFAEELAVDA
jgi:hypothetical protein